MDCVVWCGVALHDKGELNVFDLESRIKRRVEMSKLPVNALCLSGTGRCV